MRKWFLLKNNLMNSIVSDNLISGLLRIRQIYNNIFFFQNLIEKLY